MEEEVGLVVLVICQIIRTANLNQDGPKTTNG